VIPVKEAEKEDGEVVQQGVVLSHNSQEPRVEINKFQSDMHFPATKSTNPKKPGKETTGYVGDETQVVDPAHNMRKPADLKKLGITGERIGPEGTDGLAALQGEHLQLAIIA
jgi:hypothetical protein